MDFRTITIPERGALSVEKGVYGYAVVIRECMAIVGISGTQPRAHGDIHAGGGRVEPWTFSKP